MGFIMIKNEYLPLNNKFRIFGYIVSLIGLFQIIIPQNQWIIIPAIIQNFYTLRALKNGPHKDIFTEVKQGNLLRLLLIGFVVFIFFSNVFSGFIVIIYAITKEKFITSLLTLICFGVSLYLSGVIFNPEFGSNLKQKP